jgi:two-component system, OmpR family, response regulator
VCLQRIACALIAAPHCPQGSQPWAPPTVGGRVYFNSVLYVDDDPDICSVVQATLRLVSGLQVQTADSGERAIDLAYEFRPELVLMDVMMPGLDGPSTLKRMQQSALLANTPVIFMTAKVLPVEISQFLQLGAIGVIVKPFDPLKLYEELCTIWVNADSPRHGSTAPTEEGQIHAQVNSLTISFLHRARADGINLANMIERAQNGDRSLFKEMERIAHSLHGAGAMFGFPQVSAVGGALARTVEGLMAGHAARASVSESTALQQLTELGQQLKQHVEAAWKTAPQSTAMFQGTPAAK